MIRSGEHVLWDAHLERAQLRELLRRGTTSAEALSASFAAMARAFDRASVTMREATEAICRAFADRPEEPRS